MTRATTSGRVRRFTAAHPMVIDGAQSAVFATCGLLLTATAYGAAPRPDLAERYAAPVAGRRRRPP